MTKRKNRSYTDEFRREAVALITEQGYSVSKAAASLGVTDKLLYNWKAKFEAEKSGSVLSPDERAELIRLRKENQVAFETIKQLTSDYPVTRLCSSLNVSRSAYYAWLKRPPKRITQEQLHLYVERR